MKILQLTAENVKRLKVVDITPKGDVVEITGPNESGKTSVLDSIWWAIAGERVIQSEPIRQGEEEARIRLDLGEIIVQRRFTKGRTTVICLNPAGAEPGTPDKKLPKCDWGTPQEILNSLMGSLAFDPLAFSRKSAKEQLEELKRIVPLEVDIEALERQNDADFKARTDLNRSAKELRTRADGFKFEYKDQEPIDIQAALSEIEEATKHNAAIAANGRRRIELGAEVERLLSSAKEASAALPIAIERKRQETIVERERIEAEIKRLEGQIAGLKSRFDEDCAKLAAEAENRQILYEARAKALAELPSLDQPRDVALLRARVETAQRINREVERRAEQQSILAKAVAVEVEAEKLTVAMDARTKQKEKAIKAAPMPVPGLGFGPGYVTYNGVPFEQASDAVRLRVSTAIAMAGNPKLKVIRIRDGSLLDDKGRKLLAELASEKGYQVWVERVDSTGKIGIVMEDGEVVADNQ